MKITDFATKLTIADSLVRHTYMRNVTNVMNLSTVNIKSDAVGDN